MPIADLAEARDLDAEIQRLLAAPTPAEAEDILRGIFAWKLDFDPLPPGLTVALKSDKEALPPTATRIATAEGVLVALVRWPGEKVTVAATREASTSIGKAVGDHLLVATNADGSAWHFIYLVRHDGRDVRRRIVVERGQPRRTAMEQLAKIYTERQRADLRTALESAFNVDAVTKVFFREYKAVFEETMRQVQDAIPGDEPRRLFCQILFNRLMFLYFLQRKGWLRFNGRADYLQALREASIKEKEGSFYRDRLRPLFFEALNKEPDVRGGKFEALLGDVPFLNGGLFEVSAEEKAYPDVDVPNAALDPILGPNGLFNRWNFTVTESTPYDIEVAVDPEMLGKVFEELVTGRHESGSYYTPKPIVSFMCREALKGYLEAAAGAESTSALQRLVDDQDASSLHNPEAVLDALRKVKVCDPACGSGAYLLGMLHELLELRACLFAVRQIDYDAIYERKLEIIQNNIYGVDKDPFAIGIAQLRLWLSLIVDYEGATPPALPNLDFKIEVGDSLTGPNPSDAALNTDIGFRQQQLRELQRLKAEYLVAHGAPKAQLRSEIETLQNEIAILTYGGKPTGGFDWAVEFSEVFIGGGFDIAVANPPYVRMELFKDIKPILRRSFPNVHSDRADLYCYFYSRAIQLLKTDGVIAYISSNK